MPKITGRRIDKARELYETLQRGPNISGFGIDEFTPEIAEKDVKRWLNSWVTPIIEELCKEVAQIAREKRNEGTKKALDQIAKNIRKS